MHACMCFYIYLKLKEYLFGFKEYKNFLLFITNNHSDMLFEFL